MSSQRKKNVKRAVAIAIPAGLLLALWFGVAPAWLSREVAARLEARLGVPVRVKGASLRTRGFVIEGIRFATDAEGVVAEIDAVGVRGSLWRMASEGAAAIEHVQARGARVAVDASSDDVGSFVRSLRGRARGVRGRDRRGEARSGARARPVLEARSVDLTLRDEHGPLITTDNARISLREGELELSAARLEGDPRVSTGGYVSDVAASFGRLDATEGERGKLVLRSARVGGGHLLWTLPAREEVSGNEEPGDGPEHDEGDEPEGPRYLDRLRRAAATLSGANGNSGAADDGEAGEGSERAEEDHDEGETQPGVLDLVLSRLAPDLRVQLSGLDVEATAEDRESVRISSLEALVEIDDAGSLRTTGSGEPSGDGTLSWDLHVEPRELRGEGEVSFEGISLALVAPLLPPIPWYEPDRAHLRGVLEIEAESVERLEG